MKKVLIAGLCGISVLAACLFASNTDTNIAVAGSLGSVECS